MRDQPLNIETALIQLERRIERLARHCHTLELENRQLKNSLTESQRRARRRREDARQVDAHLQTDWLSDG